MASGGWSLCLLSLISLLLWGECGDCGRGGSVVVEWCVFVVVQGGVSMVNGGRGFNPDQSNEDELTNGGGIC